MSATDEFAGKRVTVMGLGRFGGGVGVTRFLVDRGADVLVTDLDDAHKLTESIANIQDLIDAGSVELRLGEHNVSDFTTCDLVVVNPAVKPGNRFVRAAEAAGIEVTTEMRLLVQRLPNRLRTIGVTGSAGKSTVTAMIGHVLGKTFIATPEGAGKQKVWVGGNIGVSLLPVLDQIDEDDWVVLELSSFMLERLKKDAHFPGWSPHIAVITNISPNHLDWHGTMEEYVAAKAVLTVYQQDHDFYVSLDLPERLLKTASNAGNQFITADPALIPSHLTPLPGRHNQRNAWLAFNAVHCVGLSDESFSNRVDNEFQTERLADFPGLPHRLQLVAERDGVRYFNDSKCTTPEAAMLAIEAFTEDAPEKGVGSRFKQDAADDSGDRSENDSRPLFQGGIHLILGGKDKGSDMKPLAGLAAERCKAVYTIGALGDAIAGFVDAAAEAASGEMQRPDSCGGVSWPAATAEVVRCGELDKAVAEIKKRVQPGDVVLLSPACASWDQFENYEKRGERFIALVNECIASDDGDSGDAEVTTPTD
jgi:UDP-N-acetylmuramoylalanine--D-glutamate ligase